MRRLAEAAVWTGIALTVISIILPCMSTHRPDSPRMATRSKMRSIALALQLYHRDHGEFPPVAIYDSKGTPLLSWRVLILPYLEEEALFKTLDLDQPWDSPHNQNTIVMCPTLAFLHGHHDMSADPNLSLTNFQMLVGPDAFMCDRRPARLDELAKQDGAANTIMLVEAAEAVPWTKPQDIEYSANRTLPAFGISNKTTTFLVATADGKVRSVSKSIDEQLLRAFITRNGKETVDWQLVPSR